MKYEQVKPNTIIPQLEERLLELIEALKKLNEIVSKQTSENYNLRIAQKHGHPQYYYVSKKQTGPCTKAGPEGLQCKGN